MPPLVPLISLLRFVPPHRVVIGKYSPRPPSALCLMGSASTVFRYVTLYPAHTIIRNFFGSMTRKLSVTSSQYLFQFLGTSLRRKFSITMLKSLNVA
jgi:hypothetical protein